MWTIACRKLWWWRWSTYVLLSILLINKYYVYRALVCSHCIDGRGIANSAVFAICRLYLSFLVYSPSHNSLQTRYHAGTVERWAAFFLAWADQRLARGTSMNIVQRLGHWALTGRGLGVTLHQHYGYCVHFGSRRFERWFRCKRSFDRFCIDILRGYPEGLCVCMLKWERFLPYLLALRWPVCATMRCRDVQVYTGGAGAEEIEAPADKGHRRGCVAALPVGGGR